MDHFAGLDVSVKETSVCIVDDTGRIVREVKVARSRHTTGHPSGALGHNQSPIRATLRRCGGAYWLIQHRNLIGPGRYPCGLVLSQYLKR